MGLALKLRRQVCQVLYPLSHLQSTPGYIFQNRFASLLLKSQWFPMTYSTVNHCDAAFPSSSEFSSSPLNKSGHCHQDTSSTIWYLSSANYIYFTPITSLCSLFSIFLNSNSTADPAFGGHSYFPKSPQTPFNLEPPD